MLEQLCKIGQFLKTKFSWKRESSPNHNISIKNVQSPTVINNGQTTVSGSMINAAGDVSIQFTPSEKHPDLAIHFIYPEFPALVLVNQSDSIAREIKYTVALWNVDLPDRDDPLPIPVSTFDFIRPHDRGGPQNLFNMPNILPLLKPGNKLLGSASVFSPNSIRGRTYIVCIVWGQNGWFAEVEEEKSGKILIPTNFQRKTREKYFKSLETMVPMQSRIPIRKS